MRATRDPPSLEHRVGEGPELVERIDAETIKEFGSAHMAGLLRAGGILFAQLLDGVV